MTHLARPIPARRPPRGADCTRHSALGTRHSALGIRHSAFGIRHCSGFTFIEILFAIIILGVGMIMIAGMLPVAIKQNSDTRDDVVGQAVCDAGYANLLVALQTADPAKNAFAATGAPGGAGIVLPLDDGTIGANNSPYEQFSNLRASRISSSDPRFRWLGFYRRDAGSSYVKLIVLGLRIHNTDAATGTLEGLSRGAMTLEEVNAGNGPFVAKADIIEGDDPANNVFEPDRIKFLQAPGDWDKLVAAPGAFVIVRNSPSDPPTSGKDAARSARNNGRIFRLANQRLDLDAEGRIWDLAAGFDLPSLASGADGVLGTPDDIPDRSMETDGPYKLGNNDQAGKPVEVWLVGRGRTNPLADRNDKVFSGPAQDVSVLQVNVLMQQ